MVWMIVLGLFAGCAKDLQGEYEDPNARVEILDDRWNEDDAKLTGGRIVLQLLYENHKAMEEHARTSGIERHWLRDYRKEKKRAPVIIFKDLANRTDEHLPLKALNESIRHELVNSGRLRFIDIEARADLRKELQFQASGMVSAASAKKVGRQVGADYFLSGAVNSFSSAQGKKKRVTYETNLILTEIETGVIAWSGKVEIRKNFRRAGAKW